MTRVEEDKNYDNNLSIRQFNKEETLIRKVRFKTTEVRHNIVVGGTTQETV